jgi:hypothetical protein
VDPHGMTSKRSSTFESLTCGEGIAVRGCLVSPVLKGGGAIDAQVLHRALLRPPATPRQVDLQQVQQLSHGGEEQHAVPRRVQFDQHAVEHLKLAAAPHQHRAVDEELRVAETWVVAHLRACKGLRSATVCACQTLKTGHLSLALKGGLVTAMTNVT